MERQQQPIEGSDVEDSHKYDDSSDDEVEDDVLIGRNKKVTIAEDESSNVKRAGRKSSAKTSGVTGHLMDEIFGSTDEDEDFEGFAQDDDDRSSSEEGSQILHKGIEDEDVIEADREDIKQDEIESEKKTYQDDDEESFHGRDVEEEQIHDKLEEDETTQNASTSQVSDFDLMMEMKKELNKKSRKRKMQDEFITDVDDNIKSIIYQMKVVAEKDKQLNKNGEAAINKLKYLNSVLDKLKKYDLMGYFLENGILAAIAEWLSPLPDKSLPNMKIRQELLMILDSFPQIDIVALKESRIGGVVNYLSNHPKETKSNRELATKLIGKWSRTIFNLSTDLKAVGRRDRTDGSDMSRSKIRRESVDSDDGKSRPRPGEKGWTSRARVPAPSTTDYANRPVYNVDMPLSSNRKAPKKILNRYEKQLMKFKDNRSKNKRNYSNLPFSIEGRKLSI